jgi:hypothetical protein
MLVGARHHRTHFETRHPSDDSDPSLVSIGQVVLEEKIFEKVYNGRTSDAK